MSPLPMRKSNKPLRDIFAAMAICAGLSGCNASDPASTSLEDSVAAPQGSSQMVALAPGGSVSHAPTQPIAALPGDAGAIASVRSHDYVNGFRQDVLLKGSAVRAIPNSLTILVRTSRQATLDEATPLFKPTEATIGSELGHQFPKIAMQVVERSSSNAFGEYGLALGRGQGTVHCLYMWQWIDENRIPVDAGVTGPISVRIRLCQANTTFDAMAALTDHLMIGRDAAAGTIVAANDNAAIVSGLAASEPPKPPRRKRVKHVAAAKREPVVRRDVAVDDPSLGAPQPLIAAPTNPVPLATDLPPQAYLGPKAADKPN